LGARLLSGERQIQFDNGGGTTKMEVRCDVTSLSFSAHVDAKGIVQLVKAVEPRNVMLVHGERYKMEYMKRHITEELGVCCYNPANGTEISVDSSLSIPAIISTDLLLDEHSDGPPPAKKQKKEEGSVSLVRGIALITGPAGQRDVRIVAAQQAGQALGMVEHKLRLGMQLPKDGRPLPSDVLHSAIPKIRSELTRVFGGAVRGNGGDSEPIRLGESVRVEPCEEDQSIHVTWNPADDELGKRVWLAADIFK
jgi:hypothetical protein